MKKLLLMTFIFSFTLSFAQQNDKVNNVVKNKLPSKTILSISAYPNPFNIHTKINFQSTKSQIVGFTVKNLLGKTVYSEEIDAKSGYNSVLFDRKDLTKGMYIYSIQTDNQVFSKRLVIR